MSSEAVRTHDPALPDALTRFMRTGWAPDVERSVTPIDNAAGYASRRMALSDRFPGETLVIPAGRMKVRSNSTTYPFRLASDFAWLTGDRDPDSVLVFHPRTNGHDAVLYARSRSSRATDAFYRDTQFGELWVGRRLSIAERAKLLGIETRDLDELATVCAGLRGEQTRVLRGHDPVVDEAVEQSADGRDRALATTLSELRLVKDEWEIAQLQDAVDATVRGFEDVTRAVPADRPVFERLIDGLFWARARHDGNDVGYLSVVASGAHATALHWDRNDGIVTPGDLLLMDMGVENNQFYTADVTRTIPVAGRFTSLQRELYEIVYASQQAGIDSLRPGVDFLEVHLTCMRVIVEGLESIGVLPVSAEEALDPDAMIYWRWTLANFGHMLGLDVHDCAHARPEKYRQVRCIAVTC